MMVYQGKHPIDNVLSDFRLAPPQLGIRFSYGSAVFHTRRTFSNQGRVMTLYSYAIQFQYLIVSCRNRQNLNINEQPANLQDLLLSTPRYVWGVSCRKSRI